jgi:ABC-type lipoprotein release transport system permease subunit
MGEPTRRTEGLKIEPWRIASAIAVAVSVSFSVLLISVAFGVQDGINSRLANPALQNSGAVNVDEINTILELLTVVMTAAMLAQTAATTFVLGVTVMRSRREEIALRRQSGVYRHTLMFEFLQATLLSCLVGGLCGEVVGVAASLLLKTGTILPVRFTALSVLGAFPVTVLLGVLATLVPAWRSANLSPALLRKV